MKPCAHNALRHSRKLGKRSTVYSGESRIDLRYGLKTGVGVAMGRTGQKRVRVHLGLAVEEPVCMDKKSVSANKHCEKHQ